MKRLLALMLVIMSSAAIAGSFEDAEALRIGAKHSEALPLYLEASKEGHPVANHWVGTYYLEGVGVEKDPGKAATYLLAAAHLGVEGSMVYLANMYYSGEGVQKDCGRAELWITKASHGAPDQEWKERLAQCQ